MSVSKYLLSKQTVKYICLTYLESENIPLDVVRELDGMDQGDPTVPPQFTCESCGGAMYPEYYKGVHGYKYRLTDRLGAIKKEVAESKEYNKEGMGVGWESDSVRL